MNLDDISAISKHGLDELIHYYSGNICWSINDYFVISSLETWRK